MSNQPIIPTAEQINQAKQAIDTYIQIIANHPDRREGAYPYYQFHEPGQEIRGTVLVFHGFGGKPEQMWRLADYLFKNGFNIYQPSIAGHTFIHPDRNWPQVDLKPEILHPLKEKVQTDSVLATYLTNLANSSDTAPPNLLQQSALLSRLLLIEPRLFDIAAAIENPDSLNFDTYYTSSHLDYLTNAQARLAEVDSIPGPVYTVGLSVGGAVALGLAGSRPDRIKKTVVYAPLLKVYGEERRQYINLAGPLDIKEMAWDPNLAFPIGCLTAANRFGSSVVLSSESINALKQMPIFMVLTENEDAADIKTNQELYEKTGAEHEGNRYFFYRALDLVPHPMVSPTEVSQNMTNRFWQRLYQETFRFLTTGDVDETKMDSLDQDPNLPQVPTV